MFHYWVSIQLSITVFQTREEENIKSLETIEGKRDDNNLENKAAIVKTELLACRIQGDNKEFPMVHEKIARIKSKITEIVDDERRLCSSGSSAIYMKKLQDK